MKIGKIFLVILCLIIFSSGTTGAEYSRGKFRHSQIWNVMNEYDYSELHDVFSAIELKKDTRFKDALEEFISDSPLLYPHTVYAIFLLSQVGGTGIKEKFEKLLTAEIPKQSRYGPEMLIGQKGGALIYMHKLGIKPSNSTIDKLRLEMKSYASPNGVIPIARGLKLHGVKFTPEEAEHIKKVITNHWSIKNIWSNVSYEELKVLGLQPDWEYLFKKVKPKDKQKLIAGLLRAGDIESKKRFVKACGDLSKVDGKSAYLKIIIGASIRDPAAFEKLRTSMTIEEARNLTSIADCLPDDILVKAHDLFVESYSKKVGFITEPHFLKEFKKRGMNEKVDQILTMIKSEMDKFAEMESKDMKEEAFPQIAPIVNYDPIYYLNWLSSALEKNPNNYFIASKLLSCIRYPPSGDGSIVDDWLRKNPEILVKALKAEISEYSKPYILWHLSNLFFRTKYDTPKPDISMMVYLPDDVFNRYFADINGRLLTDDAILVADYFNADWKFESKYLNHVK